MKNKHTDLIIKEMKSILTIRKGLSFILIFLFLTIRLSAQVTRQPYLQIPTPNSIDVRWQTGTGVVGKIYFGTSVNSLTQNVPESADERIYHEVNIAGLNPNTKYFYSLTGPSKGSDEQYFITPPTNGTSMPTRIWVISDFGQTSSRFNEQRLEDVAQWKNFNNNSYHASFILSLGDQTEDDAIYQLQHNFFNQLENVLKTTPIYTTIGNHDNHDSLVNYLRTFTLPTRAEAGGYPSGTKKYYSFDYSNIHVVVLFTEYENDVAGYKAQTEWLKKDLDNNKQDWLIACMHRPMHSGGHHKSNREKGMSDNRKNWLPVLEDHGVDLILQGHNHVYERSYLLDNLIGPTTAITDANIISRKLGREDIDGAYKKKSHTAHQGTIFLTSFAGGVGQLDFEPLSIFPVYFSDYKDVGSIVIDVNGNKMEVKALCNEVNEKGSHIWDYFTIIKTD